MFVMEICGDPGTRGRGAADVHPAEKHIARRVRGLRGNHPLPGGAHHLDGCSHSRRTLLTLQVSFETWLLFIDE